MLVLRLLPAVALGLAGCAGPSATGSDSQSTPTLTRQLSQAAEPTPTYTPDPSTAASTRRCTNEEYGFSVTYPSDWHTNEPADVQGEHVAACALFAPVADFEVLPEVVNVPIFLKHESGSLPAGGTPVAIDGHTGVKVETEVNGVAWYAYYAEVSDGTLFAAFAFDNGSAPFEESRTVLDSMIATINLGGD